MAIPMRTRKCKGAVPGRPQSFGHLSYRRCRSRRDYAPQVSIVLALGDDQRGSYVAAQVTRKPLANLALAAGDVVFAWITSVALVPSRSNPVTRPTRGNEA